MIFIVFSWHFAFFSNGQMYNGLWFLVLHVGHIATWEQTFDWIFTLPQYWQGTWDYPFLWLGILLLTLNISLVINMDSCCSSLYHFCLNLNSNSKNFCSFTPVSACLWSTSLEVISWLSDLTNHLCCSVLDCSLGTNLTGGGSW